MQPLDRTLRKGKLEPTVRVAREAAEAGARAALEQMGIGQPTPYSHLSPAEQELRLKLRAHGHQLGDARHAGTGAQAIDLLAEEVAYEHWHRMLFARFLAENNLLMYPDPDQPVPVTLAECEDLAAEEGSQDGWEVAARFASRMLPRIFRPDSPVFGLRLPPEHRLKLERLLDDLPSEVFTASDSLGWVYQFWQAKKKDEVNRSEVKIGARELPAVTQLFTEPYMVAFLLDNSLGAWWAARRLAEDDLRDAESEEQLRVKAGLPGVPLEYLRFVRKPDGAWTPAAGVFEAWPESLAELRAIDPCCGSGHFLVAALLMLAPMRMELEGLTAVQAVDAVLRDNLHGLEIDKRCVEIAAFALALAAWTYPDAGGYRPLPELNLACCGLPVKAAKEEWKALAPERDGLRIALDWMYEVFKEAPALGSLINPATSEAEWLVPWQELARALETALRQEPVDEQREAGVVAAGLARTAGLLAGGYHWVITNPPYLARGRQGETLREHCEARYPAAKNDLATVFLARCLGLCAAGGTVSIVLPQNWLFLISYKGFREKLLHNETWHLIARLGEGGFESSAAAGAFTVLLTISRGNAARAQVLFDLDGGGNLISGLDVSECRTAVEKAACLLTVEVKQVVQGKQLENPDALISFESVQHHALLRDHVDSIQGLGTSDNPPFIRKFWELLEIKHKGEWVFLQTAPDKSGFFRGLHLILHWENGTGRYYQHSIALKKEGRLGGWKSGGEAWEKMGISISEMRDLPFTNYVGTTYDNTAHAVIANKEERLTAIWCFFESGELFQAVRRNFQSLKITNHTLLKIPFDLSHWNRVAQEKYPNGLPKPYSDDPTQWIFHGHPRGSVIWDETSKRLVDGPLRTDGTVLQVAVARLLGYRWPAELDGKMELAEEAREWVERSKPLLEYADKDGIVCIPSVRGEAPAADRLLNLLAAAHGEAWSGDALSELLKQADHAGKTLETWLRDRFFTQHCQLFHHRPFIWHVWDGLRDGFAALVNYHRLDARLLERLIYTYLGDWIARQKQDRAKGVDGAEERLAAAEVLKRRLELIREGEQPYDIFVRWKPLAQQPIGWNPDLNDGARLNIRPFLSVPDVGKRGAGVLRDRPNVSWDKDRGKDVPSAPWFHLFKGERINDHHLSLSEKRAAREAKEKNHA